MIVAARQHYRGFGVIDPVTISLLSVLIGGGISMYGKYKAGNEADKAAAWAALGLAPQARQQYEALWAQQAAANAPPATPALPGWVWPAAGVTAVLIVLGGIALALRRE